MARIAGVNIPSQKRVPIGLTYIHGIGRTKAVQICSQLGIPSERRVHELTDAGEAASELAFMARAIRQALGFAPGEAAELSWSGGVLASEPMVRIRLERLLSESGDFQLVAPRHPPGLGAALYAAHLQKQPGD